MIEFDKNMYGETPEEFKQLVKKAVKVDEAPYFVNKKHRALIVFAIVLILAGTAFALTYSKGLVSIFSHISKPEEAKENMITTEVQQYGGQTTLVDFTAIEAYYSGSVACVAIVHTPVAEDSSIIPLHFLSLYDPTIITTFIGDSEESVYSINDEFIQDARQYGSNLIGTEIYLEDVTYKDGTPLETFFSGGTWQTRDGNRGLDGVICILPEGVTPDALVFKINVSVGVAGEDGTIQMIDENQTLYVEIDKTIDPRSVSFDVSVDFSSMHIDKITIQYTPYETVLFFDGKVLGEELADNPIYFFTEQREMLASNMSAESDVDSEGNVTVFSIFGSTDQFPTILYVQSFFGEEALLINFEENTVEIVPSVYSEYAGRPDYATSYNTPGIIPDHLLTVQVQYNNRTKNLRIGDKFELMHSTYHIVHMIDREVDIDNQYGIINITARRSAGEDLA